jgi:excisionase family DNA binding protein
MATKRKFAALSAELLGRSEIAPAFAAETEATFEPYRDPPRIAWRETPQPLAPRALTTTQAAAYVGVSAKTFSKLVDKGMFDAPMMLADQRRWDRRALDRAMDRMSGIAR